jgi:hypothetical protein
MQSRIRGATIAGGGMQDELFEWFAWLAILTAGLVFNSTVTHVLEELLEWVQRLT